MFGHALRLYNISFKKIVSFLLALMLAVSCFAISGDAQSISTEEESLVTTDEVRAVTIAMNARGLGGDVNIDILYDGDNQPAYLLGTSKAGYLILLREGLLCMESGEGNPYSEFSGVKKYYGGVLCYYISDNNKYYDLGREEYSDCITYNIDTYSIEWGNTSVEATTNEGESVPIAAASTATVTKTVVLPNAYSWLRRKAFGYNANGTCSAVATTLALEYIDYYNGDVVPTQYHLEYLTSKATADNIATKYPKAEAFHRFLISCGMGIAAYASNIITPIQNYRDSSTEISNTGIMCAYAINVTGAIARNALDDDEPAMLTSTLAGDYSWHTMLIYGYRKLSDGSTEWLVHPGWYSKVTYNSDTGVYETQEVWVSSATATFLYTFGFAKE